MTEALRDFIEDVTELVTGEDSDAVPGKKQKVEILMIGAEDLLAKDRSWTTNQRTTSDPYAQVFVNGDMIGQTRTVKRNCSPTWYDCLETVVTIPETTDDDKDEGTIMIRLWDNDVSSADDFLGVVHVPLKPTAGQSSWFPVQPGEPMDLLHHCRKAKGRVQIQISFYDVDK